MAVSRERSVFREQFWEGKMISNMGRFVHNMEKDGKAFGNISVDEDCSTTC